MGKKSQRVEAVGGLGRVDPTQRFRLADKMSELGIYSGQLNPLTDEAFDIRGHPISKEVWLSENEKLARAYIRRNPRRPESIRLRILLARLIPRCRPRLVFRAILHRTFRRQRTPRRRSGTSSRGSPSSDGADPDGEPPGDHKRGAGAEFQRSALARCGFIFEASRSTRRIPVFCSEAAYVPHAFLDCPNRHTEAPQGGGAP